MRRGEGFSDVDYGDVVLVKRDERDLIVVDFVLCQAHQRFHSLVKNIRSREVPSVETSKWPICSDSWENVRVILEADIEDFLVMSDQLVDDRTFSGKI